MPVATLSAKVAQVILDADSLPAGSLEAQLAFREISMLEEAIATLTGAAEADGEVGRLGAVAAALSAEEPLRALQLVRRYSEEQLNQEAAAQLLGFEAEAEREIDRLALCGPDVEPTRFRLPNGKGDV